MKNVFKRALAIGLVAMTTTAQAANYEIGRCTNLRSQLGGELVPNLEPAGGQALRAWTLRCYPQFTGDLMRNAKVIDSNPDGSKTERLVYPVFAVESVVDDPTADTGKSFVATNPAGYKISPEAVANPATAPCDLPEGYTITSWCIASCYTPDQVILLPEGHEAIGKARATRQPSVVTLRDGATLDNLQYETNAVRNWTISPEVERHSMVLIKTANGGELKVTLNHPLVDSEGHVRTADSLKVGESLVRMDGSFDAITSLDVGTYVGKVYNVDVASANRHRNIVVAQGYLNGSVMYQNEGVEYLNRVLLRKSQARFAL